MILYLYTAYTTTSRRNVDLEVKWEMEKDERKPPKKPIPNGPKPPFNHGILPVKENIIYSNK